jgi:hypothetical protein
MSVCPHGKTRLPPDGFSWNLIFEVILKIRRKNSCFIKIDKNNGYFIWKPMYLYVNISLNSSQNEKYFTQNL